MKTTRHPLVRFVRKHNVTGGGGGYPALGMCTYIYIYIFIYMYVCVYIYIYMYTHIHNDIHDN